jgi:hypothetical protein
MHAHLSRMRNLLKELKIKGVGSRGCGKNVDIFVFLLTFKRPLKGKQKKTTTKMAAKFSKET